MGSDVSGQDSLPTQGIDWSAGAVAVLAEQGLPLGFPTQPPSFTYFARVWFADFSWGAVASATSYNIYRSLTGANGPYALLANTASTAYQDHTVPVPDTTVFYRIAGVNALGEGAWGQANNPTVTVGGGFFDWDASQDRWQPNSTDQQWFAPDAEIPGEPFVKGGQPTNIVVDFNTSFPGIRTSWTPPPSGVWGFTSSDQQILYFADSPSQLTGPGGPASWQTFTSFTALGTSSLNLSGLNPFQNHGAVYIRIVPYTLVASGRFVSGAPSDVFGPFFHPEFAWLDSDSPTEQVPTQGIDLTSLWPAVETGGEYIPHRDGGQPTNVVVNISDPVGSWVVTWTDPPGLDGITYDDTVSVYYGRTLASLSGPGGPSSWTAFFVQSSISPGTQTTTVTYPGGPANIAEFFVRVVGFWGETTGFNQISGDPSVANGPNRQGHSAWMQGESPNEQAIDQTVRWYQPEDDMLGVPPAQPSVATVPQQVPALQQPDWSESRDQTVVTFDPGTLGEHVLEPVSVAPFDPGAGFDWSEQPGQERDLSVVWFAPEELFWTPIPNLSQATAAQQPLYLYDAQQDVDRSVVWFAPEEQAWVPVPNLTEATVAQDAGLFGYDPTTDVDLTVRWFAPEELFWTPVPGLGSEPTTFAWEQNPDHSESTDRTVVWYQPDTGAEWVPIPGLPSAPSAAQDAGAYQQPDWSESRDQTVTWYQPDEELPAWYPNPYLPTEPTQFEWEQQPDWSESADQSARFYQPDSDIAAWVPIPALTNPDPAPLAGIYQQADWSEAKDQTIVWYQPEDDQFGVPPFAPSTATVAQQIAAHQQPDWSEVRDQTVLWFAPDEQAPYLTPPFQPSTATVPQDAGLWQDGSDQQSLSLDVRYYQPEDQWFSTLVSFITVATVPQQAPLWIEQPGQERSLDVVWFAPEPQEIGTPPLPSAPVHPDFGYDAQQDRDQTVVWFAPDAEVEGFRPLAPAPNLPDFGWDAQQDVDLSVRWFAPEEIFEALVPTPPAPDLPDFGYDAQQDVDRSTVWFAPEECFWAPLANPGSEPTAAQQAGLNQQADWSESRDQSVVYYQPDEDIGWVPNPGLPSAPTAAQDAGLWYDNSGQQDRDLGVFSPPVDELFEDWSDHAEPFVDGDGAPFYGLEDGQQSVDQTVVWFQPDTGAEWVPFTVTQGGATVPQQAGEWYDNSGQQDRSLDVIWFQPDTGGEWVDNPNLGSQPTSFAWLQNPDDSEQRDQSVRYYQPDADVAWVSLANPGGASIDKLGELWQEQPGQERSLDVVWYQPEDDTRGGLPQINPIPFVGLYQQPDWSESADQTVRYYQTEDACEDPLPVVFQVDPRTLGWLQQPDWSESADQTVRWYQPDADLAAWTPIPGLPSAPTAAQQLPALQAYEAVEQRDQSVRYYQPEDAYENPLPLAFLPVDPRTLGWLQQPDPSEVVSRDVTWYQPEDDYLSSFIGAVQIKLGKVTASDAARNAVAPTDAAQNNVVGTDGMNKVTATDGPVGLINSTDSAAGLVTPTDYV